MVASSLSHSHTAVKCASVFLYIREKEIENVKKHPLQYSTYFRPFLPPTYTVATLTQIRKGKGKCNFSHKKVWKYCG